MHAKSTFIEINAVTSQLVRLAHQLSPFVTGYEGNVSCRLDDSRFLIKASGKRMSSLEDQDLVMCNLSGGYQGKVFPSMEVNMHRALLSLPGVRYIAHTHPTSVLKVLCSEHEAKTFASKRLFPDQVVFNGPYSILLDYLHPGTDLGQSISDLLVSNKLPSLPLIILLKNHGVVIAGETADQCLVATEICEKSAEIYIGCLGKRSYLTGQQIQRIVHDEMEKHRKKTSSDDILR
jgi:ribulose-5-phosphate 4-epimerase/fuculose-1-phosphate aldolase